jgi:asparagine synthase (glutamine-hydrolysing)
MCGITGFVDCRAAAGPASASSSSSSSSRSVLDAMRDRLTHRGPDDAGSEVISFEARGSRAVSVGLAQRRLSILDLSAAGHQPMSWNGWTIVFNGEVYNFRDLAPRYATESYRSTSDTEVVLRAIATEGVDAPAHFIGMFSFAAFNRSTRRLLLGRDRTGIKPLYYYRAGDLLLFASEPKAFFSHPRFVPRLDPVALTGYLQWGYLPGDGSIYEGVRRVPPATVMEFDLSGGTVELLRSVPFWSASAAVDPFGGTYDDARAELDHLMRDSFALRMVSDVPVGVFLSGGYDSTAVTALLSAAGYQGLETFTIGFRGAAGAAAGDEAPFARAIAEHLGTRHHELYFSDGDALAVARELPATFDEPFADTSAIPTLLLSRFTREHVTVSLSADAGDETFAGYGRYRRALGLWNRTAPWPRGLRSLAAGAVAALPWRSLAASRGAFDRWPRAMRLAGVLRSGSSLDALLVLSRQYQPPVARRLLSPALRERLGSVGEGGVPTPGPDAIDAIDAMPGASDLQRMLAADYRAFLMNDVLVKVDRATMAYSLEGRDPLMDHRIFEFAAGLPDAWKIGSLGGKHILKDIVHQYVPRELVDRPKQGFSPPMAQWLRGELRPILERATSESWLQEQGVFDPRLVSRMGQAFLSGHMNNARQMWIIVAFQMWYDRWLAT